VLPIVELVKSSTGCVDLLTDLEITRACSAKEVTLKNYEFVNLKVGGVVEAQGEINQIRFLPQSCCN